jgi:FAD/FMN-containing dehydrogenase
MVGGLEGRLQGDLIWPGTPEYDTARAVWNARTDRYPALIVRCADAEDVIAAIDFAREQQLSIAVRSGGHGTDGSRTRHDGLLLDVSGLNRIDIDPVHAACQDRAGRHLGRGRRCGAR